MIRFIQNGSTFTVKQKKKINSWIKAVCKHHNTKLGELAIVLCGDKEILDCNKTFLKHDYLTDIITFDYREGKKINGELFLGVNTIKENAKTYKTKTQDEVKRVIIHGVLHIIGFGDKKKKEQKEMTKQEDLALRMFKDMFHVKQ